MIWKSRGYQVTWAWEYSKNKDDAEKAIEAMGFI